MNANQDAQVWEGENRQTKEKRYINANGFSYLSMFFKIEPDIKSMKALVEGLSVLQPY